MTKCNNPQCPNQDNCPCGENCPCTKEHNCAQHDAEHNDMTQSLSNKHEEQQNDRE